MYSTKHLSRFLQSPESVSSRPDGPNSGYLVIKDEESETYLCFGCCKKGTLYDFPLPQNKELLVTYIVHTGQVMVVYQNPVFFIPVLNQPLSSNRYYAIDAQGEHIGEAFTCSSEENKGKFCFRPRIKDVIQRPFDPRNTYQQFEVVKYQSCGTRFGFFAKSIEPDGFPPSMLRRKGWTIASKGTRNYELEEASGLDPKLRSQLPMFDFPLSHEASEHVIVGKWYSPFLFLKEGSLRDQAKRSPYYEVTLEQRWEKIFSRRRDGNSVVVDASVEKEEAFVDGVKAKRDEENDAEGFVWFSSVGLRRELVERMKWEQGRGGFVRGNSEMREKINIKVVEELKDWNEFGCYVLVERFNFKRMDGTLVLSCDFKHCNQIKYKWE